MPLETIRGKPTGFYTNKSIYDFGHGLKYSTFFKCITSAPSTVLIHTMSHNYTNNVYLTQVNAQHGDISTIDSQNLLLDVVIGVRNDGPMGGAHIMMVFWKPASSKGVVGMLNLELVGLERVGVEIGKTETVVVKLDVCERLSVVGEDGKRKVVTGQHTLLVGSSNERQVKHYVNIRVAKSEVV